MPKFDNTDNWILELSNYIISKIWDLNKYKIFDNNAISSIFLAWAPGAWKTEFLETIFNELKWWFIIIDIDKYRNYFNWYNWENSSDYQHACVKVADKILKFCFKNNLNFIFDWTFRNYNKVLQNITQCNKYNRKILITLIFQEPRISFYYTYLRKINKKRNVPIDVFIDWFYFSIENVFKIKNEFNNIEIIIANKKYHSLNKDKYKYLIDYDILNINDFCKKYHIKYKNWKFENRDYLKFDLIDFKNILDEHHFKSNIFLLKFISKFKIWVKEKFNKL